LKANPPRSSSSHTKESEQLSRRIKEYPSHQVNANSLEDATLEIQESLTSFLPLTLFVILQNENQDHYQHAFQSKSNQKIFPTSKFKTQIKNKTTYY